MLYENHVRVIASHSKTVKPGLQLVVGETVSESGKVNPSYATFRVTEECAEYDVDGILRHMESGNVGWTPAARKLPADRRPKQTPQDVLVSMPREKGVTLRVTLAPVMTGQKAALAIRELSGMTSPAPKPGKGKKGKADEPAAPVAEPAASNGHAAVPVPA